MRLVPGFVLLLASASFAATSFRIAGPAGAPRVDLIASGTAYASTAAEGV